MKFFNKRTVTAIVISFISEMARLYMLRSMINLPVRFFLKKVYFNVVLVSVVAAIVPYYLHQILCTNFFSFILICVICIICTLFSILFVGCCKQERLLIYSRITKILNKLYTNHD